MKILLFIFILSFFLSAVYLNYGKKGTVTFLKWAFIIIGVVSSILLWVKVIRDFVKPYVSENVFQTILVLPLIGSIGYFIYWLSKK